MPNTDFMPVTGLMPIAGLIGPTNPTPPRPARTDGITPRTDGRIDLLGIPRARIAALFEEAGLDTKAAKLRAKQVYHWLYHRGVTEFEAMTDIAKTMRPWLTERFVAGRPEVVLAQHSEDGTLFIGCCAPMAIEYRTDGRLSPMPIAARWCVSSQVGCTLNCRFCHTGTMRLVRNLTPGEIVGQVMLARDALGEWPKGNGTMAPLVPDAELEDEDDDAPQFTPDGRLLTNIVMMGMGEPLYNFDNVRDALKLVMDGEGLALSKRRITLSTSGVVPMMARCGVEIGVNLAVSLHAVSKEVRDEIVPINRKYGLEELLQACADYPGASNARRITFEYVMLAGKNDSDDDARTLVHLSCANTACQPRSISSRSTPGPAPPMNVRHRTASAASRTSFSMQGSAPPSAPHVAATLVPPVASSRPLRKR